MERFLDGTHCVRICSEEEWDAFVVLCNERNVLWSSGIPAGLWHPAGYPFMLFYRYQGEPGMTRSVLARPARLPVLSVHDLFSFVQESEPLNTDVLLEMLMEV